MSKRRRGWWKKNATTVKRRPYMLEDILAGRGPRIEVEGLDIRDLEAFSIDNVAEYLYAQTDQEVWDVKRYFPCLAPPFPAFWMEYGRPSEIVSCERGTTTSESMPYRVGLLFIYTEADAGQLMEKYSKNQDYLRETAARLQGMLAQTFTPEIDRELRQAVAAGANPGNPDDPAWEKVSPAAHTAIYLLMEEQGLKQLMKPEIFKGAVANMAQQDVRWFADCIAFMQVNEHGPILGPLSKQTMLIAADGRVIDEVTSFNRQLIRPEAWVTREHFGLPTLWFAALLAISFAHCKNVVVKDAEEPAVPRPVPPQGRHLTFKVLEIGPMKTILDRTASERHTGLQRALHICRGHFASYEEKPLFGKYRGRFWIPQHVRGSIEAGAVVKDYDVAAPPEKEEPSAPERKGL
jgi:hypothetical protein